LEDREEAEETERTALGREWALICREYLEEREVAVDREVVLREAEDCRLRTVEAWEDSSSAGWEASMVVKEATDVMMGVACSCRCCGGGG
jgi:hypothetical protein